MRKEIRMDGKWSFYLTFLYLYLPVILFLVTWTKLYIAIPVSMLGCFFAYQAVECYAEKKKASGEEAKITLVILLVMLFFTLIVGFTMGWSGSVQQTGDWSKHNAIVHDLMGYDWPVYYETNEKSMLTYYIGQYLIPAYIGKLTGSFMVARWTAYIWNCLGLFLVLFHMQRVVCARKKRGQLRNLAVFLFFGGMLPLIQLLYTQLRGIGMETQFDPQHFLNLDETYVQYRSNLVAMRWVYQQTLVPWLSAILFYEFREETKHYGALLFPCMLFGIFEFVGLVPLALVGILYKLVIIRREGTVKKKLFTEILSVNNLLSMFGIGGILFLYYAGNVFGHKPKEIQFMATHYGKNFWAYVLFCLGMFGIYAICIAKENKKNWIYWSVVGELTLIPLWKAGMWNDFCMGASIPVLMILMILVLKHLEQGEKKSLRYGVLIAALCVSAIYPLGELCDTVRVEKTETVKYEKSFLEMLADSDGRSQMDEFGSLSYFAYQKRNSIAIDLRYNYYSYQLDKNVFVKYIARK